MVLNWKFKISRVEKVKSIELEIKNPSNCKSKIYRVVNVKSIELKFTNLSN